MNLPHLPSSRQALRLVATVGIVVLVLLMGAIGGQGPARPAYRHYVALGDSYTAAPYVPLTDAADGCFRSSNNYPRLVAKSLRIKDLQDRSCSGAQTADLPGRQVTALGERVPAQFEALSEDTDLVTVGIGANDHRLYARTATVCRLSNRGCPLHDQRAQLGSIVARLRPALVSTLEDVKELAPNARVLLIGYPRLYPPSGTCALLPRMRAKDRAAFREINQGLRSQMRAAANDVDVEFVDFYAASLEHHVCAEDPWVQGRVSDLRLGAALHPLPAGQAALARLVEQTLRQPPPAGTGGRAHGG